MSFEPKCDEIVFKSLKHFTTEENVNVSINLTDEMINIISTNAFCTVERVVPSTKSAQVELRVRAEALVKKGDGTFECINGENLVNALVVNNAIEPTTPLMANCCIKNIVSSKMGGNLNINVTVGLNLHCVTETKQSCVVDVGVENQKVVTATLVDILSNSQEFELEFELEQPQGMKKILTTSTEVFLSNIEAGNDILTLSGSLNTNIVYLTDDEAPKLKNQFFTQVFSHELLCSGLSATNKVWANAELGKTTLEVQGELNSAKGTILLNASVKATFFTQKDVPQTIVVDAFCPNYQLNTTNSTITNTQLPTTVVLNERVDGSVTLDENSPRIDRILCVSSSFLVIDSKELVDQGVLLRGKILANIVFTLDDEECSIQSIKADIPFEIMLKCDVQSNFEVMGMIKDIDARNKRAKEIDIIADVTFGVNSSTENNINLLSSISLGEKRSGGNSAFKIYFVDRADDLWSLGKKLGVSTDVLMAQNPDLTFPFSEPKQVLVYLSRSTS